MDLATLLRNARHQAGLSQAEVARRAGTSQPTLARYEGGLVEPSVSTLERLVRACGDDLVVELRHGTSTRPSERLARLRAEALQACSAAGAENVRVFGSVARGEDTPSSDIDLLVDLRPEATLLELAGLRQDLAALLDARVDVATPGMLKPAVRTRALAEAVPL
jgi:hypothetical protein